MAAYRRSKSAVATSTNGATTNSVTWPTNAIGDMALLHVSSNSAITTPSGWTLMASDTTVSGGQAYLFGQILGSVQSGSQSYTQGAGLSQAVIVIYAGTNGTLPSGGDVVINRLGTAGTAITTGTAQTFEHFGAMFITSSAAANVSAEAATGTGWGMNEGYDTIFGGTPSIAMADGPMVYGGSATMTATGASSAQWVAIGVVIKAPAGTNFVTYDNSSVGSTGAINASSKTVSHTTGSGSNRLLLVTVHWNGTQNVSSVTYGGTAMTGLTAVANGNVKSQTYWLAAPASGANNVVVNMSSAANLMVDIVSLSNASQGAPGTIGTAGTGSSTAESSSVTPAADGTLIYGVGTVGTNASVTASVATTQVQNAQNSAGMGGASGLIGPISPTSTATTVNFANSLTGAWVSQAMAISPIASGSNFSQTPSDTATVTESVTKAVTKRPADTATTADAAGKAIVKNISDSTTTSDNMSAVLGHHLNVSDFAVSSDDATALVNESMVSSPATGTIQGNPTYTYWDSGGFLELTTNNTFVAGAIEYIGTLPTDFTVDFDLWTGPSGADATWFYWGETNTPTGEGDGYGGYHVVFDDYSGAAYPYRVMWNGTGNEIADGGTPGSPNFNNGAWHHARIVVSGDTITLYQDGTQVLTVTDTHRTLGGTRYGWAARTGGASAEHRVRNLLVRTGTGVIKKVSLGRSDSAVTTESTGKNVSLNRSESSTTSDATSKQVVLNRAETATSTDAIIKNVSLAKSDSAATSDLASKIASFIRTFSDSTTPSETSVKNFGKKLSDIATITDSETHFIILILFVSDSVTVTETIIKALKKNASDSATTTDLTTKSSSKGQADSTAPTESISKRVSKPAADTGISADATVKSFSASRAETATATDSVSKSIAKNQSDTTTTADNSIKRFTKNSADSAATSDTSVKNVALNRSDSLATSDTASKTVVKSPADTAASTDSSSKNVVKNTFDTTTSSDSASKKVTKNPADTISVIDSLSKRIVKTLSETVTISDLANLISGKFLLVSDVVNVSDAMSKSITKVIDDAVSPFDALAKAVSLLIEDEGVITDEFNSVKRGDVRTGGALVTLSNHDHETMLRDQGARSVLTSHEIAVRLKEKGVRINLSHDDHGKTVVHLKD